MEHRPGRSGRSHAGRAERVDGQRGAATLEATLVVGLLLLLAIGAFEYGMAFRDWLSVASASREGARVAAAAGDAGTADCLVLEATAGSLFGNIPNEEVAAVNIYQSNAAGDQLATNSYRPARTDDNVNLVCSGGWVWLSVGFDPAARSEGSWIGVEVEFDHHWHTGFLWFTGSAQWGEATVMRVEPDGA